MNPKVSIIIPAYNAELYINRCIISIVNQTYENIEVIVIDDGSSDSTKYRVEEIISCDPRVKVFTQVNSGPSIARNKGIQKATGEYIMFIDSDDRIDSLYIEKLVKMMSEDNYDCVCCGYIEESKYGSINLNHFWNGERTLEKDRFVSNIFNGVGGVLWAKIFKRSIIVDNSIKMNPKIFMCEDLLFILEYCKYSNKFGIINEYLYYYNRLNENSISSNINIDYLENYINVIYGIENLLGDLNIDKNIIDDIVVAKVQSLVNSISFSESNKYLILKNKNIFIKNMTEIFNITLVKKNINKFKNNGGISSLTNRAIKNNRYFALLYLNLFNILIINTKNKILGR